LVQLRDTESQFSSLGFQIIAVSPDRQAKARETIEKHKIAFTVLSDSEMTASRAFGIAYKVDDATLKLLAQNGIDLEAASGEKHHELPVPAVFLVAMNGLIQVRIHQPRLYRSRASGCALGRSPRVTKVNAGQGTPGKRRSGDWRYRELKMKLVGPWLWCERIFVPRPGSTSRGSKFGQKIPTIRCG
jgi:peroxiredoxin